MGMERGPIPWRDIYAYAGFKRLEDDVAEAFIFVIREMDYAYLKFAKENDSSGD